jgi:hypothetical protein
VKDKLKLLPIPIPIWDWDGIALKGGTEKDLVEYLLEEYKIDVPETGNCAGKSILLPDQLWFMWIGNANDPSLVAHEALHIATWILKERGLKMNKGSEEAYTYLMQYIIEQFNESKGWKNA